MGHGIAAAHFAAIMAKAEAARAAVAAACATDPGEDIDMFVEADEALEALADLILDHPDTAKVMLALAGAA